MKTFLKNISLFISLLFGLVLLVEFSTSLIINNHAKFKLLSNPKYIILGHSHPECAFNDSLIHNFKNLAESAESYYYSYFKIKKILEQNNSIETVFIEYTNNQIDIEMDDWIWDKEHILWRYPKYSSFMSLSDQRILIQNNPIGLLNSLPLSNKFKLITLLSWDYDYTNKLGGYLYLVRDKTDSILKHPNRIYFKNDVLMSSCNSNKMSETNLLYLYKTIELIKKYNKKVILVRSPQHKKYSGYENESRYKNVLCNRFSNIEYLDFSNFPLSNSEFGDLEHLNHNGAKKFSIWFNKLIEKGLLLKLNKQEFIDNNMRE